MQEAREEHLVVVQNKLLKMTAMLKIDISTIPIVLHQRQHAAVHLHTKSQAVLAVGRIITLMQTQTSVIAIEKVLLLVSRVIAMGRPLRRKPLKAKGSLVVAMQTAT